MDRRRIMSAAIVVAVLAFVGARAWLRESRTEGAAEGASAVYVRIPGTDGLRFGELAFSPCELAQPNTAATVSALCASHAVPEDWNRPSGRSIDLRLALIRGRATSPARDLVVLLAGGPGQAATEVWPQAAGGFSGLLARRDVLLLDQRGTGGSNALTCKQMDDAMEAGFDIARVQDQARRCLAELAPRADVRQYTTGAAVRDLEAVRVALGSPPLDLVGVSYGTRVAQQFVKRYPGAVRSIVLDSAVPNDHVFGSAIASNLDASLRAQFAECERTPACKERFGDPWQSLIALRDRLRAVPQDVAYRDPVDATRKTARLDPYVLAMLARMYAYTPETAALLPLAIRQAAEGDAAPLVAQSRMLMRQFESLGTNAMQWSVICAEDADRLEPRPQDADSVLGREIVDVFRAVCDVWPRGTREADFAEPAAGDVPVLLLSGAFDPITPPAYAEAIAAHLPNARVLVAEGQGHNVIGRGCFPRLVARFVDTLDAAALDAGCVDDFAPTPAFLDFNGAAP